MSEVPHVTAWSAALAAPMLLVPRDGDDKYSRGVFGVRTGSAAYPGAAVLGVEAAWRTGLGMVRYVGPPTVGARVLDGRPETVLGAGRVQAWLIGSGTDAAARSAFETATLRELLRGPAPVVVDAGALDLVAREGGPGGAPLVLTPHDREFARLEAAAGLARAGLSEAGAHPDAGADAVADALAGRIEATRALARALGHVVLRKGATTIIAAPDGACSTVAAATPWLATAGTGDVLGGVLGALIAAAAARVPSPGAPSHADLRALAATGALLHGVAGRIAAGLAPLAPADSAGDAAQGRPITALDVAHALPEAVASIRQSGARDDEGAPQHRPAARP
ncbi:MAG TPA: NAD(P)H-hydrate dehydratase [Microbacteriaceae bacterium]|nr:NAD(P)H-hydrate dehydratase [Microbacteriaceae bacterium]